MDYKKIGQNIKKYRTEKGLTQKAFADKIGKSESSVRKYEKGLVEIPNSVLENIADILTISPSLLMSEKDLGKQIRNSTPEHWEYGLLHLIREIAEPEIAEYIKKNQIIPEIDITDSSNNVEVQDLKKKAHSIPKEALEILRQAQTGIIENADTVFHCGKDLLDSISRLNEEGQQKVKEYADDLAENSKYRKDISDET